MPGTSETLSALEQRLARACRRGRGRGRARGAQLIVLVQDPMEAVVTAAAPKDPGIRNSGWLTDRVHFYCAKRPD